MKLIFNTMAVATAFFAVAHAQNDAQSSVVDTASNYLAAYSTFDVAKMAPFYADDAVFTDPTSNDQIPGFEEFTFDGKDAILRGLGDYAAGYKSFSVHYDVKRRYESADNVVFIADLTYKGETKKGEPFAGGAPIVTVIKVKDGKVVRHTDYFDYRGNAVSFD
ncbi:MAG: nuclear transport factor 2 family protein [Parvularculaceae bacterium]|nr:nuclear transport factor 2 family protein [Parvularculaceae bacterium]